MRFLLYVSILLALVPFIFARPFFGLCTYYVVSLLQPKVLCWRGDFQDAMIVGVPLVIGAVMFGVHRIALEPQLHHRTGQIRDVVRRLVRSPIFEAAWPFALFIPLVAYIAVNRFVAPFPMEATTYQFRSLCKVLLVTLLLTGLASDLRRFRVLFIVVALSAAFWAIKGGIKVILLGPHQVYGKSYDNNLFALMSVMALPMVFYFGLSLRYKRWRTLLLICSALISLAIIGSRSRAGFVAFAMVVVFMAWSSRYRFRAMFAVVAVGAVTLLLAGSEVRDRIQSILAYEEDASARGRFVTWETARAILAENPLMGVGFNNFETARQQYVGGVRAAHNIYLQNAAELGLIGHPIWLAILVGTLIGLYRFMRYAKRLPPEFRWAYYWSRGLLLAMLAFCVHGMFHNEEYLEFMFTIVGMHVALRVTTRRELRHARLLSLVAERREQRAHRVVRKPASPPRRPGWRDLGSRIEPAILPRPAM